MKQSIFNHPNTMEVEKLANENPVEFNGKVLDQRNNLTGPDDAGKVDYPKRPNKVQIQQTESKEEL